MTKSKVVRRRDEIPSRQLFFKSRLKSSCCGAVEAMPRNQEVAVLIPGLAQWVKDPALP